MNDIEKLHQVIDALEEQSSRVTEFNGVLSAVNSAREQIESAKTLLAEFAVEQKDLVSESNKCFKGYGEKLAQLESQVESLGEKQNKIIRELAELEFVTPEKYEQGRAATERAIAKQLAELAEKTNLASVEQQAAMMSLRRLVIFGILALAGCIAFF